MTAEEKRLQESRDRKVNWKRWGPYLSERAWGTVREDYSPWGNTWDYLPHDHARSKAYRWNEDGLGGICDRRQFICFALALWNGRDPILKERLFGLSGNEGNHGEDVKEYYFYLDSTPTHSYMKFLYKYPHAEFPYSQLIEENRRRGRNALEFELLDTGIFNENRYFDVFVEYAKAGAEELLIRIHIVNRGPDPAQLHLLPTLWFRNTWAGGLDIRRPSLRAGNGAIIEVHHEYYGRRWLACEGTPKILFTENETNLSRLYGAENQSLYVKDGINDYIIHGKRESTNPQQEGTKAATHYPLVIEPGKMATVRLRLSDISPNGKQPFSADFEQTFALRQREADEFYATVTPEGVSAEARNVMRQALAGMMWSKQFYHYDVNRWLRGDLAEPPPPPERLHGRNHEWVHVYNADVISMCDKWEYPWFAAWDLAFHCIPLALIDSDFAKDQLILLLRE
jgi:hypothetical protein